MYIGSLDSDDSETEEFEIQLKDVATGKTPLNVEIEYKEKNSNVDHTTSAFIDLSVLSKADYDAKQPKKDMLSTILETNKALIIPLAILSYVMLWFIYKLLGVITGYLDKKNDTSFNSRQNY